MERGSAPTERSFSVKKQQKDILVIGFALFAMFFGAGNMIFPPKLGLQTGSQWAVGFLSFTFADAGLALLTILAMIRGTGSLEGITRRVGSWASTLLGVSVFLCLGPLMAIPRTAASTFELGVAPLLNTEARVPFALVFFALVFLLTVRPSKVIDIIGKFLTPALYIALLVMIVRGITNPVGSVVDTGASAVFAEGLKAGYQTMDMFGAIIFTVLITATLKERHYEGKNALRVTVFSGIVAAVGLTIVYGGLAYLGATGSGVYEQSIGQTALLIRIMETTMGHGGLILLAIVVARGVQFRHRHHCQLLQPHSDGGLSRCAHPGGPQLFRQEDSQRLGLPVCHRRGLCHQPSGGAVRVHPLAGFCHEAAPVLSGLWLGAACGHLRIVGRFTGQKPRGETPGSGRGIGA